MRILIAAWHLKNFNVGLGRYSRELIEALGRVDQENHYVVLMPDSSCTFSKRKNFEYKVVRFPLFKRRFWEQVAPCMQGPYDLLHFPYDTGIVWKRGKLVATVHDLKPLIFPELQPKSNMNDFIQKLILGRKWEKVDHIITVSNWSRKDIVERVGFSEEKVSVVYQGVMANHFRPKEKGLAATFPAKKHPFILTVAGNDPTKNLETLVDAYAKLPSPLRNGFDLVVAGDLRRRSDLRVRAQEMAVDNHVQFIGTISDEQLIELYQQAAVFVFPSLYEGFGLPVLEAMSCGCPVICSNASSLPEVVGQAALLIDPLDTLGLCHAIERVLSDHSFRMDLSQRVLAQAAFFSWDRTAQSTISVYKKVAAQNTDKSH